MIDDLITYLQAQCPSFNSVTHTVSAEPVDEVSTESPILYVSLGDEEGHENELLNKVNQQVDIQINFIIVGSVALIETLRNELRTAILGHEPTDYLPITFVSSTRMDIRGGYEWREVVYQTSRYFRSV